MNSVFQLSAPTWWVSRVTSIAKARGITRSQLIREAVTNYLGQAIIDQPTTESEDIRHG